MSSSSLCITTRPSKLLFNDLCKVEGGGKKFISFSGQNEGTVHRSTGSIAGASLSTRPWSTGSNQMSLVIRSKIQPDRWQLASIYCKAAYSSWVYNKTEKKMKYLNKTSNHLTQLVEIVALSRNRSIAVDRYKNILMRAMKYWCALLL